MQKSQDYTKTIGNVTGDQKQGTKRKGGVLTDRDRLACKWVCEQGVMTVDQLWRAVWWNPESSSPRYAYDRVAFLERSGFLQPLRTPYSLKTYFKATKQGQEAALALENKEGVAMSLVPLHSPPLNEIAHSDGLTELRLRVEKQQSEATWKSDRVLMIDPSFPRERFYSHVPDAIWTTPKGSRIAVEYERTRKTKSRLRLKIETFSREVARPDRAFDRVLWIGVPGTMQILTDALKNHPGQTLRTMDQFFLELKGAPASAVSQQVGE